MRISDWSSDVCSSYLFFPSHRLKRTADEGISEGHARRPCWANGHEGALVLVGNLQCRLETLLEGAIRGCVHDEAAQYLRGHFLPSFSRLSRSAERRVGNECVSKCSARWSPDH